MKKIIYYNWTRGSLCDEYGDPISGLPAISFGEKPQWELVILEEEGGKIKEGDLSGIAYYRAALDVDFTSGTEVMCRTLPENITSSGNRITLTLDATTVPFLAAVDGKQSTPAFFELTGMDDSSNAVFHLLLNVEARMMLDPIMPEDLPPALSENLWAEKGYVDSAIAALDPDRDGIVEKARLAERAEKIDWEGIENKVIPTYSAGENLLLSEEGTFSLDTRNASPGEVLSIDSTGKALWKDPDTLPEEEIRLLAQSAISSAVITPEQITGEVSSALSAGYAASAGYAGSAGHVESAASAGYAESAASALSIPWGGITEKPDSFPPDTGLLTNILISGGSAGQIPIHTGSSYLWQTPSFSAASGGAAAGKTQISTLNSGGCMVLGNMPFLIQTNSGGLYPVSGGFVSSSAEGYLIDPSPYLLADGQTLFTGTWTVYTMNVEGE